jgi:hypothetical protein
MVDPPKCLHRGSAMVRQPLAKLLTDEDYRKQAKTVLPAVFLATA